MRSRILALAVLLTACLNAEVTAAKPTLVDVIFDPGFLKESMGTKFLVVTDEKTGEISPKIQQAIRQAGLDEGKSFYALPKDAKRPEPIVRGAPVIPVGLRRAGASGKALFLLFIGADGTVKGIYCQTASNREYAVAGAAAIAKWRFAPAKIDDTPVPVLVEQLLAFEAREAIN